MTDEFIPISKNVADQITDMIFLQKRFLPNDKLPNEHELAQELSVSRTTIREAVKALVANGILTIKRGKGTYVSQNPGIQNDPFGMSYINDKKNLVTSWFEFRSILEPANARLAATRASDDEISAIVKNANEIVLYIREGKDYIALDQEFHALITKAAHNDVIQMTLPSLVVSINEAINISNYIGNSRRSIENVMFYHPLIANFIKLRDAEGAELAMRYHVLRALSDMN